MFTNSTFLQGTNFSIPNQMSGRMNCNSSGRYPGIPRKISLDNSVSGLSFHEPNSLNSSFTEVSANDCRASPRLVCRRPSRSCNISRSESNEDIISGGEEIDIGNVEIVDHDDSFEIYEFVPDDLTESQSQTKKGSLTESTSAMEFPRLVGLGGSGASGRRSEEHQQSILESKDMVMNKLRSVWYNVKYGWTVKMPPNFSASSPIYLLGRCYFQKANESHIPDGSGKLYMPNMETFSQDFASRLWFTYRSNFSPLPSPLPSDPHASVPPCSSVTRTTDTGWGCMLRSGQMMMAQALMVHFMHRSWNYFDTQLPKDDAYHRQIIRWLGDSPHSTSPLSIHQLVRLSGKSPGEWYGPSAVCLLLQQALAEAVSTHPQLDSITIYIADDRIIYAQDIMDLARGVKIGEKPDSGYNSIQTNCSDDTTSGDASSTRGSSVWKSVIVMVPMFLGGSQGFNMAYRPVLERLLQEDSCIGMIGGRPKHSVYFVGYQNQSLIYLDPHFCQETVNINRDNFKVHSYHCLCPRKMSCSRVDPSCSIGFYLRTENDLQRFLVSISRVSRPPYPSSSQANQTHPVIEVVQGSRPPTLNLASPSEQMCLKVHHFNESEGKASTSEYVFC